VHSKIATIRRNVRQFQAQQAAEASGGGAAGAAATGASAGAGVDAHAGGVPDAPARAADGPLADAI
jgi:hypothetical protein